MPYTLPDFGKETQAALNAAKLGTIDFFKAPVGTAYDAAGVWRYMGRAKAGSFKNDFSRKFYDLMTGVPETTKESFVIGMEAKVEVSLIEPTAEVYNLATGNGQRVPGYGTVPLAGTTAAASTVNTVKLSAALVGLKNGDELEVVTPNGKEYVFVTDIQAAGIDVHVYPKLSIAPIAAAAVKRVTTWEFGMGGSLVERIALRAVFHATDESQIITWVKDARADGVKDDFKDNKSELEVPLAFTLFGFKDPNFTGPIVAKKYLLTKAAALTYD